MTHLTRRDAMRFAGGVATAGAAAAPAAAADTELSEWFSNTSNYDGVVDRTGKSEVTVEVGVEANGGAFGYGPAAIRVDPGTAVTWEWTGDGGSHNVVASDGAYESELVGDAGHTFSHAFEREGVSTYYCTPHKSMGMKGAVVVGDVAVGGGGGDGSAGGDGGADDDGGATTTTSTATGESPTGTPDAGLFDDENDTGLSLSAPVVGGLLAAALSPFAFGAYLARANDREADHRRSGHEQG